MSNSANQSRFLATLVVFLVACSWLKVTEAQQTPTRVEIRQTEAGDWQLLRNGKPFYINGAGCDGPSGDLASAGANSIRGWHITSATRGLLDEAHENGLAMTVGIWLNHERHGMNYQDYDAVTKQIDTVEAREIL